MLPKRMGDHEASSRRFNGRTNVGSHMCSEHSELKPKEIASRGRVDVDTFFNNFQPKLLMRCKDTLDTYLNEGLLIEELKPSMNEMMSNG